MFHGTLRTTVLCGGGAVYESDGARGTFRTRGRAVRGRVRPDVTLDADALSVQEGAGTADCGRDGIYIYIYVCVCVCVNVYVCVRVCTSVCVRLCVRVCERETVREKAETGREGDKHRERGRT